MSWIDAARARASVAVVLLASALLAGCPGPGEGPTCPPGEVIGDATVSYANDVRPIFEENGCLSGGCHGGSLSASGFDLRTYASSFQAGSQARSLDACPIVPGDPDASYLVQKLRPNPPRGARMPFLRAALTTGEVETIATWIREGAADN